MTPHGGGYEMKYPIDSFKMFLDKEGLNNFVVKTNPKSGQSLTLRAQSFKDIRDHIVYRRKLPLMKEVFKYDLAEHVYDLKPLKQIYPPVSETVYGIF